MNRFYVFNDLQQLFHLQNIPLKGHNKIIYKQVAKRATIAHLRANFTFSYSKSMADNDPRGLANLDLRGMIGRIYVGYH